MNRILFYADASSIHTRRWVAEMAARGFDCVVATRQLAEVPGASDVVAIEPGADATGWFKALPAVRRLARQLQPQWLHGHYVTSYGLWAASCSEVVAAPLVLTAWGSDILVTPQARSLRGRAMRSLVRHTLSRAALVTADSLDMIEAIRAYHAGLHCEQILWGADTHHFKPAAVPQPSDAFEIVSLRAWEANYQIDTVLKALALMRNARPQANALLHLLGGGEGAAALRAQAEQLGLGSAVRFTGRVGDAEMVQTLQRCRVSVSVPESDATSVSVLESMACGLPVVASLLPANAQWLDPALLVPAGDAAALAAVLVQLHDDPQWAQSQGRRNRERVLRDAAREPQMDRMASLYRALRAKVAA